jgi:hypothetical protein
LDLIEVRDDALDLLEAFDEATFLEDAALLDAAADDDDGTAE